MTKPSPAPFPRLANRLRNLAGEQLIHLNSKLELLEEIICGGCVKVELGLGLNRRFQQQLKLTFSAACCMDAPFSRSCFLWELTVPPEPSPAQHRGTRHHHAEGRDFEIRPCCQTCVCWRVWDLRHSLGALLIMSPWLVLCLSSLSSRSLFFCLPRLVSPSVCHCLLSLLALSDCPL